MSARIPSKPIGILFAVLLILQASFFAGVASGATAASEHEGDVAVFTVTHNGANKATVQVGSREANYMVNITVRGGYDEKVNIRMNTYKAGGWTGAPASEVFSAGGGGRIVSIERATGELSTPIEPSSYRLYTRIGGKLKHIDVLDLNERHTNSVSVLTAPSNVNMGSLNNVQKHSAKAENIALGDYFVAKINASGLEGYISSAADLEQETEGVSLSVYTSRPNAGKETIELSSGRFFRSGDRIYVVFDTGQLDFKPEATYHVKFTVDGDQNPFVKKGETETVTTKIRIREREINFNEDPIVVGPVKNQEIKLSTTVAPGTKFSFKALSESVDNPFVKWSSATVTENGTLSPSFNFNGVNGKTSFKISIQNEDVEATAYVGGVPQEDTTTPTTTTTPPATTTTQGSTTTTPTGTATNPSGTNRTTTPPANSTTTSTPENQTTTPPGNTTTSGPPAETTPTNTGNGGGGGGGGSGGVPTNIVAGGLAVIIVGVIVKFAG